MLVGWEAHYDRSGRSGRKGYRYIETATAAALGSGGAAAMALRAACSGIELQDHTRLELMRVERLASVVAAVGKITNRLPFKILPNILEEFEVVLSNE